MKNLITVLALTLVTSSAFARGFTTCSGIDKDGNGVEIAIDAYNFEAVVSKTDKDGKKAVAQNLRIYIMNANSPGFYYYEGLSKAPGVAGDPQFFRMRLSDDNTWAKLTVSEIGAEKKDITTFSSCTIQ